MLLADKTVGRFIPVRFLSFSLIGGLGVVVHLAVMAVALNIFKLEFSVSQTIATITAIVFNFSLNNLLTYRDRRLRGWKWAQGLLSFMFFCSIGAVANVGIASYLFVHQTQWVLAALAGILMGAVWNYSATQFYTWGAVKSGQRARAMTEAGVNSLADHWI